MAEADRSKKTAPRRSFAAPKHKQITERLLADIESGRWTPGTQIPSEERLAEETGASLGTIRRALRSLSEMGVLERHQGRGTFVSGARAPECHLRHFRFVAEGSQTLLPVYFKVLDVEETQDCGPWQQALQTSESDFVRIRRIVSVNGEFDIFSEVYLPADRFRSVVRMPGGLNGVSIRDMLAERFNAPTLQTYQTALCQTLPPRVTRLIGVPPGQYGIVWTICGMSYRALPITWQRIFIPPSDRALQIPCFRQLDVVGRGSPA